MTMKITERRGRQYGPKAGKMLFSVRGTADEAAAINAVVGGTTPLAPMIWGDLARKDYNAVEIGFQGWEVDIDFGSTAIEALPGVTQWSYTTDGGTILQKYVLNVDDNRLLFGDVEDISDLDIGAGININGDGTIDGVERIVSRMQAEARTRLTTSEVNAAYLALVQLMTGSTNDGDFNIWAEGEALFAGARIQQVNATQWDASFLFLGSPNSTDITVDSISGITKEGWQYLWVYAKPKAVSLGSDSDQAIVPGVKLVVVDNIYDKHDFNALGIPS